MDVVSPVLSTATMVVERAFAAKQLRDDCVELGKLVEKLMGVLTGITGFLDSAGENELVQVLLQDVESSLQHAATLVDKIQKYSFIRVASTSGVLVAKLTGIKEQLGGAMDRLMGIGNMHMAVGAQQQLNRGFALMWKNFQKQLRQTEFSQAKEIEEQIAGITRTVEVFQSSAADATQQAMEQFKAELRAEMRDLGHLVKGTLVSGEEVDDALKQMESEVRQAKATKQELEDCLMEQLVAALSLADGAQDDTAVPKDTERAVPPRPSTPPNLVCPIGLQLMKDPVMLVESGQVFDRQHIEEYLARGNRRCPVTRQELSTRQLVPVYAMKSLADEWRAQHGYGQPAPCRQVQAKADVLQQGSPKPGVGTWGLSTPSAGVGTWGLSTPSAGVSTWGQLCALLQQGRERVIDLGGRTLEAGACSATGLAGAANQLVLSQPGLVLRNGHIKLPAGCRIQVTAVGEGLKLQDVTVHGLADAVQDPAQLIDTESGSFVSTSGLIAVAGGGAKLEMSNCFVHLEGGAAAVNGVLVGEGAYAKVTRSKFEINKEGVGAAITVMGEADVQGVTMKGVCDDGLVVWGAQAVGRASSCRVECIDCVVEEDRGYGWGFGVRGGVLHVTECTAVRCGTGFIAAEGGRLEASGGCSASDSHLCGFKARGSGSLLIAGARCAAAGCKDSGFAAVDGGRLEAEEGCQATDNVCYGFCASQSGSVLVCGRDCTANRNKNGGFNAGDTGRLEVGQGCKASGNGGSGFQASEEGSCLTTGTACRADRNEGCGFNAYDGAKITTGMKCIAEGNESTGFFATTGGRLEVGEQSESKSNKGRGFSSRGTRSIVSCGHGCAAEGNDLSGFLAIEGGMLEAGQGCKASGNGGSGFEASEEGSCLTTRPACRADRNAHCGFYAYDAAKITTGMKCMAEGNECTGFFATTGGRLEVGEKSESKSNKGCGFCSRGTRSTISCKQGCAAEGNNQSGFLAIAGGMLEAGQSCRSANNGSAGYHAEDAESMLVCFDNCVGERNKGAGFYAGDSGRLEAGKGCRAASNTGHGFISVGAGSMLGCGAGCAAERNQCNGFYARGGGTMEAGEGCQATGNLALHGFSAEDKGSVLVAAQNCVASGNQEFGFFATNGGRLEAGEGCQATGNLRFGFGSQAFGSLLVAGPRCVANGNREAGFWANEAGHLQAKMGCQSFNSLYGYSALGSSGLLLLHSSCIANAITLKAFHAAGIGSQVVVSDT